MDKINPHKVNISFTPDKAKGDRRAPESAEYISTPVQSSALELMSNINRSTVKKHNEKPARPAGMNDAQYEQYLGYLKDGIHPEIACILINQADWDPYYELEHDMAAKNLVNDNWTTDEIKQLYGFIGRIDIEKLQEVMNNEKIQPLFSKGNVSKNTLAYILDLDTDQMKNFESNIERFVQEMPNGANVEINKLQNGAGVELFAQKENTGENATIVRMITLDENGQTVKGISEYSKDGLSASEHCFKSDKTIILNFKPADDKKEIESQIEIVNPQSGESPYIIYTRESDSLKGAYETVKYDLSHYPEDLDVLQAIKDGTIEGGEVLSEVKSNDGVITYRENYQRNGSDINRNYVSKTDENGDVVSVEYSYNITDENGNTLLNMLRSWEKNQDGTTTTIINGKEYIASFDETNMEISVKTEDETVHTIRLQDIMRPSDKYSDKGADNKELQKEFFNFCKTLSADQLISLSKHVDKLDVIEDLSMSGYNFLHKRLKTGCDYSILSHELGHAEDTNAISSYENLSEIYNEEMEIFKSQYPKSAQNIIKYFSQTGGSFNTGLSEFIAETNMLMANYNHNNKYSTRAQYLVRYFPKTVAKAAQLLGY